jgi:hypothetical protein
MFLFSVGNGAMNASRGWQLRDDACSDVVTSAHTPCFFYPFGALKFGSFRNCQQLYEVARNL